MIPLEFVSSRALRVVRKVVGQPRLNNQVMHGWVGQDTDTLSIHMFSTAPKAKCQDWLRLLASARRRFGLPIHGGLLLPCCPGSSLTVLAAAPSTAAPAAPAATASAIGAASSTVPSAANSVIGARLADFAHGWYVKGQVRALGLDLR